MEDFLGIKEITEEKGVPVLENVETIGEFAALFRADYDRMKMKDKVINACIEAYMKGGEYDHKAYHPVKDFLSGLLDMTIIKPVAECIMGKDLITGEELTDTEKSWKMMGACIDLFTLGQGAAAIRGAGLTGKQMFKAIGRTMVVDMVSNGAGYTVAYGCDELGMPMAVTWMLGVLTGCTVSATAGKYILRDVNGAEMELLPEDVEDFLRNRERRTTNIENQELDELEKFYNDIFEQQMEDSPEYLSYLEYLRSLSDEVDILLESGSGERLIPGEEGVVTGGDSTKLGKNMMESMGLPRGTNWTGHQAQHIIPAEMANHPVLQKIGMDLDDASNGLFLRTPAEDISAMSRHRGYHSTYNEFVRTQLDEIDINQSVDVLQKQVYDLQQNLKYLQQSGLPLYPSQGATVDLWQRSLERIQ